jgi:hypothetical protein
VFSQYIIILNVFPGHISLRYAEAGKFIIISHLTDEDIDAGVKQIPCYFNMHFLSSTFIQGIMS